MGDRGNRVITRYKKKGRRRLPYGTRIRKHALGLFEGKKYIRASTGEVDNVIGNNPIRGRLLDDMKNFQVSADAWPAHTGQATIATKERVGRETIIRGIKLDMLVQNKSVSGTVDVRIILGWRKINAEPNLDISVANAQFHIFKDTLRDKEPVLINESNHVIINQPQLGIKAPISKKYFHLERDIVFRLGPTNSAAEAVFGPDVKHISLWWELNNKRNRLKEDTPASSTQNQREAAMEWYPVYYIYHCNPFDSAQTDTVSHTASWVVYYKDPLG